MKAQLRRIISIGDYEDLKGFSPDDPKLFGVDVEFEVGSEGETGTDRFRLTICTPDWLKANLLESGVVWGRHILFMRRYDYDRIEIELREYCDSCTGDDWVELANKIARIGRWEFEDYVP